MPHAQLLLLFTTSAQTHIFPEIRVDAIRFLDIFLEIIPDIITEGWAQGSTGHGRRVLEGYLGVLSAGTAYAESGGTLRFSRRFGSNKNHCRSYRCAGYLDRERHSVTCCAYAQFSWYPLVLIRCT